MQMHLGLEELGKIGGGAGGGTRKGAIGEETGKKKKKEPREEDPKGAGLTTRTPGQVSGLLAGQGIRCAFGRRPEAAPTVNLM